MAVVLNDNIQNDSPKALDNKAGVFEAGAWRPYNSTGEAVNAIPKPIRHVGLVVNIMIFGQNIQYWFGNGVEDEDLVPVQQDTGNFILADSVTPQVANINLEGNIQVISDADRYTILKNTGIDFGLIGGLNWNTSGIINYNATGYHTFNVDGVEAYKIRDFGIVRSSDQKLALFEGDINFIQANPTAPQIADMNVGGAVVLGGSVGGVYLRGIGGGIHITDVNPQVFIHDALGEPTTAYKFLVHEEGSTGKIRALTDAPFIKASPSIPQVADINLNGTILVGGATSGNLNLYTGGNGVTGYSGLSFEALGNPTKVELRWQPQDFGRGLHIYDPNNPNNTNTGNNDWFRIVTTDDLVNLSPNTLKLLSTPNTATSDYQPIVRDNLSGELKKVENDGIYTPSYSVQMPGTPGTVIHGKAYYSRGVGIVNVNGYFLYTPDAVNEDGYINISLPIASSVSYNDVVGIAQGLPELYNKEPTVISGINGDDGVMQIQFVTNTSLNQRRIAYSYSYPII